MRISVLDWKPSRYKEGHPRFNPRRYFVTYNSDLNITSRNDSRWQPTLLSTK